MMKNAIVKFLIATLLLPGFLSLVPATLANEIHGLQHASNRVSGFHQGHIGHVICAQPSSQPHSTPAHNLSDQHILLFDLSTYFNDYLNVDLRLSQDTGAGLSDPPNDHEIQWLVAATLPLFTASCIPLDQCSDGYPEDIHCPSVLSTTKRLRI